VYAGKYSYAENGSFKLANALERASRVARRHILRSSDLSRGDRSYLLPWGYLQEIIKGWYLLTRPVERAGESTAWYAAFGIFSRFI